jgi:hypothetical protein
MNKYWFRRGLFSKKSKFSYYPISIEGWVVVIIAAAYIIFAFWKTNLLSFFPNSIFWFLVNLTVTLILLMIIAEDRIKKK